MIRTFGFVLAVSAALGGCAMSDDEIVIRTNHQRPNLEAVYAAAVADPLRPAEEVARDPLRHPEQMLAFAGLQSGDRVADIRPGAGYFTRLFARSVGETGKVYAFVPNRTMARENAPADALVAAYPNVERINGALDAMAFPEPLDVVFMSQEYHDFHIPAFETDVDRMNAAVFAALKPGGRYIVIDHAGRPGTTNTEVQTLLFAEVVGPQGSVVAWQPAEFIAFQASYGESLTAIDAERDNVTAIRSPIGAPEFPQGLDLVFTAQNYHDLHLEPFADDTAATANAAVFAALKPGGVYVVIDHYAVTGAGLAVAYSLHRIDIEDVKREVQAAGFVLEAESDVLALPDDPRTANVFDSSIRGKTSQFMLRFRKPA